MVFDLPRALPEEHHVGQEVLSMPLGQPLVVEPGPFRRHPCVFSVLQALYQPWRLDLPEYSTSSKQRVGQLGEAQEQHHERQPPWLLEVEGVQQPPPAIE